MDHAGTEESGRDGRSSARKSSYSPLVRPLPRPDGNVEAVVLGRERAYQALVVTAGRVIEEVKINDQGVACQPEVGTLGLRRRDPACGPLS